MVDENMEFSTRATHYGIDCSHWKGCPVIEPISLSTTFKQDGPSNHHGYEYSRSSNPTRESFEKCLASLENAKHGLAFSSGLAATTTILLSLKSNDKIICCDDAYGGTGRLFRHFASNFNIDVTLVDFCDFEEVKKSVDSLKATMVWIESPTNPLLKICNIKKIVDYVHNNIKDAFVIVDNTFMTPVFQKPLDLGADIVIHSVTKYLNGHSDVVMGVIATNNDSLYEKIKFLQNAAGAVPSPFDCYLASRGLRTLEIRMHQIENSAMQLAQELCKHSAVKMVIYPGLKTHPQHDLCFEQSKGFGGMISIYLAGGRTAVERFMLSLKIFCCAESLGGFDSLANHPITMTHASVPPNIREKLGITDSLIRLSIGLEHVQDLKNDLFNALNSI